MNNTDFEKLYHLVNSLYLIVADCDRLVLERFNLSTQRFFVLTHLRSEPGASFTRLSELTLTDKAAVSRIVRSMELDGLIERQQSETDRRLYSLYLTREGQRLLDEVWEVYVADIQARFAGLDADELPVLLREGQHIKDVVQSHLDMLYHQRES